MTHTLHRGTRPLLVSIPHMGTAMPFSLLREVRVICSSRAATTASSKKSS